VQLEMLIPLTGANERPSLRVAQKDFPELFVELRRVFDAMWRSNDLSVPPALAPPPMKQLPTPEATVSSHEIVAEAALRAANKQRIDAAAQAFLDRKATIDQVVAISTLPVQLKWGRSMSFEDISDSPEMLRSVKCVLINARPWLAQEHDMHCQHHVVFGSLAHEQHRLSIQGVSLDGGGKIYCRFVRSGTWRLDFRVEGRYRTRRKPLAVFRMGRQRPGS
jgi:hypothetical protein